ASTGKYGAAASTGKYGAAAATDDYGAAAATGDRGAAAATGWAGAASATGWAGAAVVTGAGGRVQGGPFSALALAWRNPGAERYEMRVAEIGVGDGSDGKLRAHVWYRLDDRGHFVEAES